MRPYAPRSSTHTGGAMPSPSRSVSPRSATSSEAWSVRSVGSAPSAVRAASSSAGTTAESVRNGCMFASTCAMASSHRYAARYSSAMRSSIARRAAVFAVRFAAASASIVGSTRPSRMSAMEASTAFSSRAPEPGASRSATSSSRLAMPSRSACARRRASQRTSGARISRHAPAPTPIAPATPSARCGYLPFRRPSPASAAAPSCISPNVGVPVG